MSNTENIEKNFEGKKKGKIGLIIACIVLVIAIIAGICAYFIINSQPKNILKKYVNKLEMEKPEKMETVKFDTKVTAKIKTNDDDYQEVLDEIAKCTLKFGSQLDVKNKVEIVNLGLDYDNENVIDGKIVYKDNIYIYLDKIFDKYIKLDIQDEEEMKNSLDSIFTELGKDDLINNSEEIVNVTKSFLKDKIDSIETIESEDTKITVNEKEKKVKKITVSITMKEFANYMSEYFGELAKCKMYESNEDAKNMLKEVAEGIKETEFDEKDAIKLNLYTEGLNNDFVCCELELFIEEQNINVKLKVLKENKNEYKYTVSMSGQGVNVDAITGTIKVEEEINNNKQEKGKLTYTVEVAEILTDGIKINGEIAIEYNAQINSGIDNENIENYVDSEEISDEDLDSMLEKLLERPLIGDLLSTYMNADIYEEL